ncbi:MAG: FHA domain-containing protein [Fimbriimonas sp.]|nr:FHA domain-containing protein [Fimbriimonas sp.]
MKWIECKVGDEVKRLLMVKDPIGIGRSANCEFSFPHDREVSRLHAIIELRGEHWYLADQKSTNGSLVNGQRVTVPFPLKDGDVIQIGEQRLHVKSGLYLGNQDASSAKHIGYPHHYIVLKVPMEALQEDIDSAYGSLRAIFDPTLHPGNPFVEPLLAELEESYEILRHPESRSEYDATIRV